MGSKEPSENQITFLPLSTSASQKVEFGARALFSSRWTHYTDSHLAKPRVKSMVMENLYSP